MSLRANSGRLRTMPRSPTSRWNVLNNEGKTVNLFREYAAKQSTHIRWMAGHGLQISEPGRVPPGRFVVFMGAPGQLASTDILSHTSKAYTDVSYLRNVFAGREKNILPTRLGYWKTHVYGPGDPFPDLNIDMWDYSVKTLRVRNPNGSSRPVKVRVNTPQTPYNKVCGVKDMSSGRKILYEKTRTVSQVISSAPGIYLIMACRASAARIQSGNAERNYASSNAVGQTAQRFVRRVRTGLPSNAVNVNVQAFENAQGRVSTRKRMAAKSVNKTTAKRKKPLFYFPVLPFAPGRPTPAASTKHRRSSSRRPRTSRNGNTVTRNA